MIASAAPGLNLDCNRFENKIRGINLAMRMGIRNAHHLALVLEYQDMVHFATAHELAILRPANSEDFANFSGGNSARVMLCSGL